MLLPSHFLTRFAVLICFCAPLALAAGVPAHVDQDTTWTGDVQVADNVTISPGVTLTIDNAKVQIAPRCGLRVQGRLLAKDSSFTATSQPSGAVWAGITIEPLAFGFTPPRQAASEIRDCAFDHAETAIRVIGHGLLDPPTVSGCTIRDCTWGGIVIDNAGAAIVEKNVIENVATTRPSDQGRPLALLDCTDAKIRDNFTRNSSDAGIFLYRCRGVEIHGNRTEHVFGGPGPGLGGYYKRWGFGALLQECQSCRLVANHFTDSAYIAICLAYGCNDNVVESNECDVCLDAINVVGEGKNNLMRSNRVTGGWSILYLTGSGPVRYEKCDNPPTGGGGGACFTVRTGDATFVNCNWDAGPMNIWGGVVRVDGCKLRTSTGPSLSLMNGAVGTLVDCDFDAAAMTCDAKATGHVDVQHRLTLTVVDAKTGKPLTARVSATDTAKTTAACEADARGIAVLPLTEFTFSAKGKTPHGPWEVSVEREGYAKSSFSVPMNAACERRVELLAAE